MQHGYSQQSKRAIQGRVLLMGALKNNQNAKKDVTADNHFHIRVTSKQNNEWIELAKKENKTLTQWIIFKLSHQ